MRRERGLLWVVLAGFVAGILAVGAVAVTDEDDDGPRRLPALAIGGAMRESAAGDAAAMSMPAMVDYEIADGVPNLDGDGRAFELTSAEGEAALRRLAAALGVDGAPRRDGGGWVIADDERELRLEDAPGLPWFLGPRARCPDAPVSSDGDGTVSKMVCAEASTGGVIANGEAEARAAEETPVATPCPPCPPNAECACAGSGATEPAPMPPDQIEPCPMPDCPPGAACIQSCPAPRPMPEPERPADLPSRDEAEAIALGALEEGGLDVDGAVVRVDDGITQWFVNVDPRVGGLRTVGMPSSVGVGSGGVVEFANGWAGTAEGGETYPLAGVRRAVERLEQAGGLDHGFGVARDLPAMEVDVLGGDDAVPEPERIVQTVTDAEVGLLFAPFASGPGAMLVPAYLLEIDGQTESFVPAVAVADESLPEPDPASEPGWSPYPTPGDGSGGRSSGSSGSTSAGCAGSGSPDGVEVQLCGPSEIRAGEEATFTLTVVDARGAFIDSGCAEPSISFGDGTDDGAVCDIGCAAPADPTPKKHSETASHAYEQPGRYAASAFVRSCGEGEGDLRVELPVTVQ